MFLPKLFPLLLSGASIAVAGTNGNAPRSSSSIYQPRYRNSSIDGSVIALPTEQQLTWQDSEIGVIIHYNLATYISVDGCNNDPSLLPGVDLFDPTSLNTTQWADTISKLGAGYGTLVAKHNCGFTTWPSNVTFPTTSNEYIVYNYTVAQSPVRGESVVHDFVDSTRSLNLGHGFYYSLIWNNFLRVNNDVVDTSSPWVPGQVNITNSTFEQIWTTQLVDLWSNYGPLSEIWLDGGFVGDQASVLKDLIETHQPDAVVFNGCDDTGTCVSDNSVRWVGTEAGPYPSEIWSSGLSNGGDPESPYFCPAECDTTLQNNDRWFYGVGQSLRSLQTMIDVYHATVGNNCLLELDLAPDRSGLVPPDQVAVYSQIGDFIQSCYGKPITPDSSEASNGTGVYHMRFDAATLIDRIMLMEDQTDGQVIRSYHVYGKLAAPDALDASGTPYILLSNGTSVGHKKIDIFEGPVNVTEILVNSTFADTPTWRSVSVHLCSNLPWSQSAYERIDAVKFNASIGTTNKDASHVGGKRTASKMSRGNWLGFYNVDFGNEYPTKVVARIASGARHSVTGTIHINVDSPSTVPVANISVTNTGGWEEWTNTASPVSNVTGYHDVYLTFSSNESTDFVEVDWFMFR